MENKNTDTSFKYIYSAKEQDEIRRIREKYQSKEEDGISKLRKMDAKYYLIQQILFEEVRQYESRSRIKNN